MNFTLLALKSVLTPPTLALTTSVLNFATPSRSISGALHLEPDRGGVIDVADDFADVQQRFGRNAAPVETDAADLVAVDADHFLAELSEPDRGVIAAGARADDDGIVLDVLPT